ncbi:MAG TPA: alanine racemase [Planctomycetota bacterium]|nr:alanine racemase [Planctomycetota bacterium]
MDAYRVWADIDLDALAHNLARIRERAGPGVAVMLVVKADAYGHGAVAVAHHALRCGVAALGVGTSAEALELREAGVRAPILVLGTIVDEEAAAALRHDVQIALHSSDRCQMLQDLARRLGLRARVHLKIDTGMGRLGVLPGRALDLLREVRAASHLELAGVMTHLGSPDGALDPATCEQIRLFESVLAPARAQGLVRGWVHAANSACLFTGLRPLYDAVRPGISAYGVLPGALPGACELAPVLSLHSQVVFLKDLPAGAPVGYGASWRTPRATRIATIPTGYNDGLPWRVGNRGEALVRGTRAPIVGRVSMDYTTLDVGHIPGVAVGERVTLIGSQGGETLSLEDLARHAETIPYEITCAVGKRVERIYRGGEIVPLAHAPRPARVETGETRDGEPLPARSEAPRRAAAG